MDDKEKEKFGVVIEKEKQPEGDQSKVEEKTLESENLTPKTENNDFLEKSAGRRSQHSPFFSWGSPPNPPWSCRRHKLRSGW